MKNCKVYHELMNIKGYLQDIETYADDLNGVDIVTKAQYGIQDAMTRITDELLEIVSSKCYERSIHIEHDVRHHVYSTYIPGEDKTAVWRDIYVGDELISSQLTGWYCGEPDDKTTEEYSKPNSTGYYLGVL